MPDLGYLADEPAPPSPSRQFATWLNLTLFGFQVANGCKYILNYVCRSADTAEIARVGGH